MRVSLLWLGALLVWAVSASTWADTARAGFPALDRPAMQVKAVGRTVLLAVTFAGDRIVAVGERGVVVLSDDGGRQWRQARAVPVAVSLTAVQFVDAMRGWAVGHGAVILHTQDGGETWTRQIDAAGLTRTALQAAQARHQRQPDEASARQLKEAEQLLAEGLDKPLLDLAFTDAQHGYVVGAYNLFFETRDGGKTWTSLMDRLENPSGFHLYAVRVRGEAVFIAGEQGLLFRSLDAGRGFQLLPTPYNGSWFVLDAPPDGDLLVAGLRGNAFHSADQGQTWSRITGGTPATFVSAVTVRGNTTLMANQAGGVLATTAGKAFVDQGAAGLPPLADILPLGDGSVVTVGLGGVVRLPALKGPQAGGER